MKSSYLMSIAFGAGLLGGCIAPASHAAASDGNQYAIATMTLAAAGSCGTELSRFQHVLESDLQTGNVNQSVYDQIQRDLSNAARACDAGRDGEAITIMRSTKSRHGYRADA